jgi:hypothetical protein
MLAFGGASGLVAQTLTYPLDVVRRHMQVSGLEEAPPRPAGGGIGRSASSSSGSSRSRGAGGLSGGGGSGAASGPTILGTARHILREAGPRGFFRGLGVNFVKVVPSTAIGFTVYDSLKEFLGLQAV